MNNIYTIENENESSIHLVRDRKFFQAYERSAFRFVKFLREYKVHSKFVKKIMNDLVYLGFPDTVLPALKTETENLGYVWNVLDDTHIEITGLPSLENFETWKGGIVKNVQITFLNKCNGHVETTTQKNDDKVSFYGKMCDSDKQIKTQTLFRAYKDMYKFTTYICNVTCKFYKNFKFGLGDKLREQCIDVLEHFQLFVQKITPLQIELCIKLLLRIRIELRLALDLKQMSNRQWIFANNSIQEILEILRPEFCNSWIAEEGLLGSSSPLFNEEKNRLTNS